MLYANYIFVTNRASAKILRLRETSIRSYIDFFPRSSLAKRRSKENREGKMAWMRMSYGEKMLKTYPRPNRKRVLLRIDFSVRLPVRNSPSRHNLSANDSAFARKHHSPTSADLYRFSPSLHPFPRLSLLSTCAEI